MFVIKGGTPRGDVNLCLSCRWATVVSGPVPSANIVDCSELDQRMRFPVTTCSAYNNKKNPSLAAMEDLAWIIRTKKINRPVGFAEGVEVTRKETEVVITEPKKKDEGSVPDHD